MYGHCKDVESNKLNELHFTIPTLISITTRITLRYNLFLGAPQTMFLYHLALYTFCTMQCNNCLNTPKADNISDNLPKPFSNL